MSVVVSVVSESIVRTLVGSWPVGQRGVGMSLTAVMPGVVVSGGGGSRIDAVAVGTLLGRSPVAVLAVISPGGGVSGPTGRVSRKCDCRCRRSRPHPALRPVCEGAVNERRLLGDDLARVLDGEPFGLPCEELARRVHRRFGDVRATLRADPRFVRFGRGRGSRWRLATGMPLSTPWARMGRVSRASPDLDPSGVPIVKGAP